MEKFAHQIMDFGLVLKRLESGAMAAVLAKAKDKVKEPTPA